MLTVNDVYIFGDKVMEEFNKYAFYDMNGDGIPELLLWASGSCYILTINDDELAIWLDVYHYSRVLNSGNILNEVENAAPNHITYVYTIFDFNGNEKFSIEFAKYDDDENGKYDKDDTYYFDGVIVNKKTWDKLTKRYLNETDDKIEWMHYKRE